MERRTARVEHHRVYDGSYLTWWLFLTGDGHWCRCTPSKSADAKYQTEDAALIAGDAWIHFGIQPNERTDAHKAAVLAMHKPAPVRQLGKAA